MDRAVAGDEEALSQLLGQHGPAVRAQVSASMGAKWQSVLDADDVMQVTYLEAFLRIDRFQSRGEDAFPAWLAQIARNNLRDALDELSRLKRPQPENRIIASGEDSAVALLDKIGCTTTTPSRHTGKREVQQAVEDAVDRLPEDYAAVIRMYDLQGQNAADVARAMGRTEGAVFMLRARAHDRLRESLGSATRW
ncbi:MAG: RNA polymerase sigma factor [Phycisphaerae bacterium]